MGRQINFIMDDQTEIEFVKYIRETGGIILNRSKFAKNYKEIHELPEKFSSWGWGHLYLCKSDFFQSNEEKFMFENDIYEYFPVIEYARTAISENDLCQGRLWMEIRYYDEEDQLQKKGAEFEQWYNELSKWSRKHVKRRTVYRKDRGEKKYYVSESLVPVLESILRVSY